MEETPIFPFNINELKKNTLRSDDIFYRRAVEMIDIGFNNGMERVTLFKLVDPEKDYYLNLPNHNWVKTLEDALEHFKNIEDYEMCSYTKDILEKISV